MDNMESRAFVIKSESNPRIRIEAVQVILSPAIPTSIIA